MIDMLSDFDRSLELIDRMETDQIKLFCYDLAPDFNGIYKTYEYCRLCTIITGEKLVSVNDNDTFQYDSKKYLLLPPESNVHMEISIPTKALVFELNSELIKQVIEKVSNEYCIEREIILQKNYYVGENKPEFKFILNRITDEFLKKESSSSFLIDLHAQELVYNLIRIQGASQIIQCDSKNPVYKAIQYMNKNCMKRLSIKQLAYDLNMSEANFCQYFKKVTGIPPNEYFIKLKLEQAKSVLKQKSVTETAYDLGYDNISYFISIFKKTYGITPKQFKKAKEQGRKSM